MDAGATWDRAPDLTNTSHVPGGVFRIRSGEHDPAEPPVHRLSADEFWLDRPPTANRQVEEFVRATRLFEGSSAIFAPPITPVNLRNWAVGADASRRRRSSALSRHG
jgi:formylglycine-generating enzyme required for sulfatase activity